MRHKPLKLTDYGPAPGWIDTAIESLLVALLAFMPLAFGAVEPWSEFVATAAALTLAALLIVRRFVRPDCPGEWTWAYVPLALYLLLVLSQLVSLPQSLVSLVSPETAAAKARLLADLPDAAAGGLTLSFYPAVTRHDLRVVLIAVVVFTVVVEVYRRPEQVRRLLLAVTCAGGAVAAIGLAQRLTSASGIYWFFPTPTGVADAGPFVNHNHYAQYLNLSIGAAMGLLVLTLRGLHLHRDWTAPDLAAALREPGARGAWLYAVVVVGGVVAVFLSMSRGGMISLLVAAVFATVLLARKQNVRHGGWVFVVLMLVAFVGVLYAGFDAVYDRLAAIKNHPDATGGRLQIVQDVLAVWRKYPVAGTGLGTHAYVFPSYDRSGSPILAAHAENEYAQALEETGAGGLALVLAFAAIVWANFARAARARRPRVCVAAIGLGYGLLAVMVHSLSDFGQHVPAVAALSAVTCALLIAMARLARHAEAAEAAAEAEAQLPPDGPRDVAVARPRRLRFAIPAVAAALLAWAAVGADASRRAASDARRAERAADALADKGWEGDDQDYTRLLESISRAAAAEPDNVEHRYWLNAYRWRAMARERDPDTGDLVLAPEALDFARRIVDELHAARRLCPTFGPPVSLAGQLELFVLDDPAGAAHIREGYALAPNHPDVVFAAAMADASAGDFDASVEKFRRVVTLRPLMLPEVVDVYEYQFDRPDLAVAVAKHSDNPTPLLLLAQRLTAAAATTAPSAVDPSSPPPFLDREARVALAVEARAQGVRILAERSKRPDATPELLASLAGIYQTEKQTEAAIDLYSRALLMEYTRVDWRMNLARLLAGAGQLDKAIQQAEICLRLRPGHPAAEQLVGELMVRQTRSPGAATAPADRARAMSGR